MADPTDVRRRENWTGGYYELTIRLGPCDDDRVQAALTALWSAAGLGRPRLRHSRTEVAVTGTALLEHGALASVARLGGGSCVCLVDLTREEGDPDRGDSPDQDWLTLSLPLGALAEADRRVGGYPFQEAPTREWREPLEQWLVEVATSLFTAVPFAGAVTGFEVAGHEVASASSSDRVTTGLRRDGRGSCIGRHPWPKFGGERGPWTLRVTPWSRTFGPGDEDTERPRPRDDRASRERHRPNPDRCPAHPAEERHRRATSERCARYPLGPRHPLRMSVPEGLFQAPSAE